ncbi:MAG: hypothetical protein JO223_20065 [Hyphomicrobiales bacterium]|nr:hypothetical protein [Hyphomicrobiales bacterium]MBV8439686.1 hypothetical protein [Hyphomicrobiales bacterium]
MARAGTVIRVLAVAACGWGAAASAQQADSPLKSAAKIVGFATDVGPPADFVLQSRPQGDLDFIPVFQPPPEPAKPSLGEKDLKAVRGDLDSVEKTHDAIRKAFPPAAKALAEQKAAEAKKAQAKPPATNQ